MLLHVCKRADPSHLQQRDGHLAYMLGRICPIFPPSIAPLQSPMIPPIGTSDCRQVQAVNLYTGQYHWRMVCQ